MSRTKRDVIVTFRLTPATHEALKALAEQHGRSLSNMVYEVIRSKVSETMHKDGTK